MFKHKLMFKIITLITIQTFIFTSSAGAYPTLGNLSKVEKKLRVPNAKVSNADEIGARLGMKELVWDNGMPVNLKVWKRNPENPQELIMIHNPYIWTDIDKNGVCKGTFEVRSPEPDLFRNFELLSRIPSYRELKGRIKGKNVLIRVNVNEPDPEKDATRLDMQKAIIRFVLDEGGTPILIGHGGRLDRDKDRKTVLKDNRFSFKTQAEYIQRLFPEKQVVFHNKSIRRCNIDKEEGLRIEKSDIQKGAINIIENVRFGQGAETGSFRETFADQLARLSDGIFIFDAFGDIDSKGASVEDVPQSPFIKEVYLGPEMSKEFAAIKTILEEGFEAMVTGGNKLEKLAKLEGAIKQSLNEGGFVLLGSGLSDALDKSPEQLAKFQAIGGKEIISSDYSDETHNDIGEEALEQFLTKLDTLKPGNKVVVNGTMGLMEGDERYKEGTKKIYEKLDKLADRGIKIIVVGGDATKAAKKYGLLKNGGVQSFSGGGVALTLLSGEVLRGINALAKAQERIAPAEKSVDYLSRMSALRRKVFSQRVLAAAFPEKDFKVSPNEIKTFTDTSKMSEQSVMVIHSDILRVNQGGLWALESFFKQLKQAQAKGLKLVLAYHKSANEEDAGDFYENIKQASNIDLSGQFDYVVSEDGLMAKEPEERAKEVIKLVKDKLPGVERIELIGPQDWAETYQTIVPGGIENCLVIICELGENKLARTDLAIKLGVKALVDRSLLSHSEGEELEKELSAYRTDHRDFYRIASENLEPRIKGYIDSYQELAKFE